MDHLTIAQLLGNYGEFVGAIAVVVTLIYLARQVRANSEMLSRSVQASRIESSRAVNEGFDRWRSMIVDTESEELWFRGINDLSELNRAELIRFTMIASTFIWNCSFMYQQQRTEGLYPDVNEQLWQDLFVHPGFREWLNEHYQFFSHDFGDFLREAEAAVGTHRLKPGKPSSLLPGKH